MRKSSCWHYQTAEYLFCFDPPNMTALRNIVIHVPFSMAEKTKQTCQFVTFSYFVIRSTSLNSARISWLSFAAPITPLSSLPHLCVSPIRPTYPNHSSRLLLQLIPAGYLNDTLRWVAQAQLLEQARRLYSALDLRLGEQDAYFFGATPTSLDACVFGHLAEAWSVGDLLDLLPAFENMSRCEI